MNLKYHKNLLPEKWFSKSLTEQLANVGSEVSRTIIWKNKGDKDYQNMSFERALELLDLTLEDPKLRHRLRELCRLREVLVDWNFDNEYKSSDQSLQNYFLAFNHYARLSR